MAPVPIQREPEPFKAVWLRFRFSKKPNHSKPFGSGSGSEKTEPFKAVWLRFQFSKNRTIQSRMAPVPVQQNPNRSELYSSGSDSKFQTAKKTTRFKTRSKKDPRLEKTSKF